MDDRNPRSRSDVSRKYGYPWPWKVEEILREEFRRKDGDVRELANAFECHPNTVDKWIRRYGIRDDAGVEEEDS